MGLLFRCSSELFLSISYNSSRGSTTVSVAHQRKPKHPAYNPWKQFLDGLFNLLLVYNFSRLQVSYFSFVARIYCLFSIQPNLQKSTVYLLPLVPIALSFVLSCIFQLNWTSGMVWFYQHRIGHTPRN